MERTKIIKTSKLILLILLFPLLILAQQGPNFLLPSPQSQQLNKYIDFPVDHSTGVPQITIPLYVLKTKGLEIPISLNYHASGIKYGQDDGMFGLGWTLSCDYRVSRTIYGYPDAGNITMSPALYESQMNYFETNLDGDPLGAGPITIDISNRHLLYPYRDWDRFLRRFLDVQDTENNMPLMGGIALDGEYDQFYYQIPNGGGKFIISDRATQTITEFNPSMNRFTYSEGTASNLAASGIIGFEIQDAQQNLYSFGEKLDLSGDKVIETNKSPLDQRNITAWALTDIDTKYGEKIKFQYKDRVVQGKYKKQVTIAITEPYDIFKWNHNFDDNRISNTYSVFSLSSIRTKDEKIDFSENSFTGTTSKVTELVIRDSLTNTILKKIEFFYHTKEIDFNTYAFIDSLKIFGSDLSKFEKYSFTYYDESVNPSLFLGTSIVPDQWGFQMVSNNPGGLLHIGLGNDYMRHNGADLGATRLDELLRHQYGGYLADLESNSNPEIYSLRSIVYPTGGSTLFEFEPNISGSTIIGGMRVKQISLFDGNINSAIIPNLYLRRKYEYSLPLVSYSPKEIQNRKEFGVYYDSFLQTRGAIYSSIPFGDFTDDSWIVFYQKVSELIDSQLGINGKIVYQYSTSFLYDHESYAQKIHDPNGLFAYHQEGPRYLSRYKHWQKSPMIGKYIYDSQNNLVKKEKYEYSDSRLQSFTGLKVRPNTEIRQVFDHDFPRYYISANSIYSHGLYTIETGRNSLNQKTEVDYLNGDSIITTTNYLQNFHGQVIGENTTNSKGQSVEVTTSYTWDSPDYITNRMKIENDLEKVFQQTTKRNGVIVDRTTNNFQELPNNIFVLNLVNKLNTNTLIDENAIVFHKYDASGNVQSLTQKNGTIINYLWSYDSKYPIAEVKGISFTELESLLGGTVAINTFSNKLNPTKSEIDALLVPIRNGLSSGALSNIELNSYTYNRSLGLVTSKNDGAGRAQYFEYDGFGRLKLVKNDNNAIEQVIEYNYRNDGGL